MHIIYAALLVMYEDYSYIKEGHVVLGGKHQLLIIVLF